MVWRRRLWDRGWYLIAILTFGLALAACSGPDGEDADDTPTAPQATATVAVTAPTVATATSEPSATSTATVTATVSPTATATATPTPEPTAPPTVAHTPTPSATPQPLPSGGADVLVYGKAVREIVAGNADGSILYAITASGVSRTHNGGRTWTAAGEVQAGELVVALNEPDVLYAGGRGNCAISTSSIPMRRSTDGGLTWEEFVAGEGIEPLLVEAGQNSKVVGTDCTLQVSVDGGLSFRFVPSTSGFDVSGVAVPGRELGDEMLVIGTSEGGTSMLWKYDISSLVAPEPLGELARFYGLGAAGWTGERMVLATSTGVGVSDDGGATWRWSRAGLEAVTYSVDPLSEPIPDAEQGRPFGFSVALIDGTNPERIYIGGALGAFRSADGGQTWTRLGDESAVDSIVVATALDRIYVSADGGTRAWTLDGN